ncbi:hypothetical protein NRE35_004342 [Salmonella enterica]|nr:hypothetical protein [Salmonella enterica subsp. enterica serovar Oslo]EEX4841236.1 hypothetical protein [Escherichia coli]EJO2543976.1 hypothetical protein [Salmonella enterica]ELF5187197.1 hypothetical protein [Salmonella enterica]
MSITRRVLGTQLSTPSFEAMEVSLEEEVIAAVDSSAELQNAEAESGEIERLQDVADHTAQSVDYIETQINTGENGEAGEATQNEVALAEQVANLATVGTGEDADTVMPSNESYIGSTISCEGLKETVRAIIRAVIAAIKKLWERLKKFWRSTMSRLSSLKKSAQELKTRAAGITGAAKEKKIKMSSSVSNLLAKDGSVQKDYGAISGGLKDFTAILKDCSTWGEKIAKAGEDIADAIRDLDATEAAKGENKFVSAFVGKVKGLQSVFGGMSNSNDKRFADKEVDVQKGKTLLGERALFSRTRKYNDSTATSRNLASYRVWLDSASDKVKDHNETEFSTLSSSNVGDLAETVIDLVDAMAYYGEGKGLSNVEKSAGKVETALDKLGRANDLDEAKSEDAAALRRMISLGHAFADWARNPTASVVNHCCAVCRAALTVGTRSLAQH